MLLLVAKRLLAGDRYCEWVKIYLVDTFFLKIVGPFWLWQLICWGTKTLNPDIYFPGFQPGSSTFPAGLGRCTQVLSGVKG